MNKLELIQKIKQLDGLSQDEKAYLLNLVNTKKKYGLVWEDKPEDVEELLRTHLPVLREVPEKRILAKPQQAPKTPAKTNAPLLFDEQTGENLNAEPTAQAPNHILIEGDNLHALTALTFTHEGRIDVIYIDPPYNRGENDFIYNDNYIDKEDSFKHSKWLSFMNKRLSIAKNLLRDTGVIFISIDDNEVAQMKLLCDELFLEKNFIEIFSWEKTQSPSNLSNKTKKRIEYVLCYEKIKNNNRYIGLVQDNPNDNPLIKSNNNSKILAFPKDALSSTLNNNHFFQKGEYGTKVNKVTLHNDVWYRNGKFEDDLILESKFVWTQSNLEKEIEKGTRIIFKGKSLAPRYDKLDYKPEVPPNLIDERWGVATNDVAKNELQGFGINNFEYPKPVSLIKYLISFIEKQDSVVLDFFAGTGTTLQAVVELNNDDNGTRQCFLVSNNEVVNGITNKICEEITYKRVGSVFNGYRKPSGEEIRGISNNNLRYYKTEFVSREPSLKNKKELTRLATELLCIKEDCYQESTSAYSESVPGILKVFENQQGRFLCVIYDDNYIDEGIEALKQIIAGGQASEEIKVYVFSNGQYPYTEDFEEMLEQITLCALPDAIYKAYMNVLPKKQREFIPELEEPAAEEGLEILDESEGDLKSN